MPPFLQILFGTNKGRVLLVALLMIFGSLLMLPDNRPKPDEQQPDESEDFVSTEDECERRLLAAIRRLRPGTLALAPRPERAVVALNRWMETCGTSKEGSLNELALKLTSNNPRVTSAQFTVSDSDYIRNCLLLRDLTRSLASRWDQQNQPTEAQRVDAIFSWVIRNVSLLPADSDRVALGLFETLVSGKGTAEDRVWIFAESLRQQAFYNVFAVTSDEAAADGTSRLDTASLLVVVGLADSSVVYDPTAGTIVRLAGRPATVSDLSGHARWKSSGPQIVAQLSTFAPRMMMLEENLPSSDNPEKDAATILYVQLTPDESSNLKSILELATEVGGAAWPADSVGIWEYPERRAVAAASRTQEQVTAYNELFRMFDAPFERNVARVESMEEMPAIPEELSEGDRADFLETRLIEEFARMSGPDSSIEDRFGKPSRRLLKTRIQQLMGQNGVDITRELQQVRIAGSVTSQKVAVPKVLQDRIGKQVIEVEVPTMILEVNQSSKGSAIYWTGICQLENGSPGTAITTFKNYRRQIDGQWNYPSMMAQIEALLLQDRKDDAAKLLAEADNEANPEHLRAQVMLAELSGHTSAVEEPDDASAGGDQAGTDDTDQ